MVHLIFFHLLSRIKYLNWTTCKGVMESLQEDTRVWGSCEYCSNLYVDYDMSHKFIEKSLFLGLTMLGSCAIRREVSLIWKSWKQLMFTLAEDIVLPLLLFSFQKILSMLFPQFLDSSSVTSCFISLLGLCYQVFNTAHLGKTGLCMEQGGCVSPSLVLVLACLVWR